MTTPGAGRARRQRRAATLACLLGFVLLAGCATDATPTATPGSPAPRERTDATMDTGTGTATATAPDDLTQLAADGYVFGYPLVVSVRTLQTFAQLLGVNRPFTQRELSGPQSRVVVAPNVDTLYAIAVLDLRAGPLLLTVPDIADRYHTFQLLDAWTESFAYLGTRTTGGRGGTWLLAPPGWTGTAPPGAEVLEVPTPQAFLLGRVVVDGPADVAEVTALTDRVAITPLDTDAAPPPTLGPPPGEPAATGRDGLAFWDELGRALADNPPTTDAQRELLARLGALGVGPGRSPSTEVTDPAVRAALERGIALGDARIDATLADREPVAGWRFRTDIGTYGDDLDTRAAVARAGWGANVPDEAVYLTADQDAEGRPLDGRTGYRVTFPPGQAPPVDAFWSLTLYGPDRFFVANDAGRYAVGDRTPGLVGPDGTVEVVVASAPPPGDEARWLPAPEGRFTLMLRLYLPRPPARDGSWTPPVIEALR